MFSLPKAFKGSSQANNAILENDAFADFPSVAKSENIAQLQEYIVRIHKAHYENSIALRDAYGKIESLTNENREQKTNILDLTDENSELRREMKRLARQSTDLEDVFSVWQSKLVEQAQHDRALLNEEHLAERERLKNKVAELEEALHIANDEIHRQRILLNEHTASERATSPTAPSFSSFSTAPTEDPPKQENGSVPSYPLEKQIIDITEKRVSLQFELEKAEEENDVLKLKYLQAQELINTLKNENKRLKEQLLTIEVNRSMESIKLD
ncbi:uncharacterized protein VTP21DRAFT_10656 [Calcarisporiella thermophila]|uniref:uncharacterized protein n=1 Tax=Calcarisporiella thermophila TaxID=911321 RepID=UPI0037423DE3